MSTPPSNINTPPAITISSITTHNMSAQQARNDRQNTENDATAAEDNEKTQNNKRKEKVDPIFKGRCTKMNGNVFELSGEGGTKTNQFTETMTALYRYASQELDCIKDLDPLFTSPPSEPNIPKPPMQPPLIDSPDGSGPKIRATRDYFEYHDWKNECDNYGVRKKELIKNNMHLFAVILEQCSTSVENKLKGSPGYLDANCTHDCYWLILTLKNICHNFKHHKYKFNSLIAAKQALFNYRQHHSQPTTAYHDGFCELVNVLETYGGSIHNSDDTAPKHDPLFTALTTDAERDYYMRDRNLAALYLHNADSGRFGKLGTDLEHAYSVGQNEYPVTLQLMHELLLAHEPTVITPSPSAPGGPSSRNHTHTQNRGGRRLPTASTSSSTTVGSPTSSTTVRSNTTRPGKRALQIGFCMSQVSICLALHWT
jgi:hypothetical protein